MFVYLSMGCLRARMLQRCNHTRVTRVTGMAQHASSRSCLSREARRVEASQRHYDQRALQHPGVFCNTRLDSRYAVRLLIGVSKTAFRARVNTAVRTSPGDSGSLVHVKTLDVEYYNIHIFIFSLLILLVVHVDLSEDIVLLLIVKFEKIAKLNQSPFLS